MNATSYLSLTRNYSLVLLLMVFFALEGTSAHLKNIIPLAEARSLLVAQLLDVLPPTAPAQDEENGAGVIVKTEKFYRGGFESYRWELRRVPGQDHFTARLFRGGSRPWASASALLGIPAADTVSQPDKVNPADRLNNLKNRLEQMRQIEFKLTGKTGSSSSSATDESEMLAATLGYCDGIEAAVFDKRTALPGLGIEFNSGAAPWLIALAVIGLLAQMRNLVRRSFLDSSYAIEEPWLVLDGRRGVEKAVAVGWAAFILIAPWMSGSCLIAVTVANGSADGWAQGIISEFARFFILIVILLLGGWCSVTLAGELLRLRHARLGCASRLAREADKREKEPESA